MSAIAGIFAADAPAPDDGVMARVLGAMRARGADRVGVWRGERAALGVGRAAWELAPGFAGPVFVVAEGDLVVAADASLYYRDELRRALARDGIAVGGDTPSHLILAAHRRWGDDCAAHLDGDFAFVVWNLATRRVCAARDFGGKRPLYYAQRAGTLVIASTIAGVLAHPDVPDDLDLTSLAETASGLFAASHCTAYAAIRALPAGSTLAGADLVRTTPRRHWVPAPASDLQGATFEEAAAALSDALDRAIEERRPRGEVASVWMSGGVDSPAVFAAAARRDRERGVAGLLVRPVSVSYPPGDPGREDELIAAIAERWSTPVRWLDIRDIPFFDRPAERAARRDDPFGHPFEMWLRALARGSRDVGARVALDGVGGDQLFHCSEIYFADLLARGAWRELRREWRARGLRGRRTFFTWAVQPLLPRWALASARLARRGAPLRPYLERPLAPWIDSAFARTHALEARERAFMPQRGRSSHAAYEMRWYLENPYFPRVFGTVSGFALEEGVEVRSPLYDRRLIAVALARPRAERASGGETKRLLRRVVRDVLPPDVVAARRVKTGTTEGYFDRSMRAGLEALSAAVLRAPLLAEFGIIDAEMLRRSCAEYVRGGVGHLGATLYFTLQVELWLRARLRSAGTSTGVPGPASATAAAG